MDENNQPAQIIQKIKQELATNFPSILSTMQLAKPPPVLVILDPSRAAGSSVVLAGEMPKLPARQFTAADITKALEEFLALVKQAGG